MILPIQVQVVRGMVKNGSSDLEIKDYIERVIAFNSGYCSSKKGKVRKWTVTIREE